MYNVTYYKPLTPSVILNLICREVKDFSTKRTYIIMGRGGPTGKSWLCEKLNSMGFKAIELSENIYDLVDYATDQNHYRICDDVGIIVLNQILPQYTKGE